MATLIPSLNSCLRRMTPGEKCFARRLKSHLEDDYLCWYDVPIGGRGQHPDFIVLHPSRGLLILEVKDWKLDTIRRIDRQSATLITANGLKEVPSPLEQARQYTHAVVKQLETDPQLTYPPNPQPTRPPLRSQVKILTMHPARGWSFQWWRFQGSGTCLTRAKTRDRKHECCMWQ